MRIARSTLDQIKDYAAERGCTEFDKGRWLFLAPNKLRSIRISEITTYDIYLWDTAEGKISMPREGRSTKIKGRQDRPEAQIDKGLPDVVRERELKPTALAGQLILKI